MRSISSQSHPGCPIHFVAPHFWDLPDTHPSSKKVEGGRASPRVGAAPRALSGAAPAAPSIPQPHCSPWAWLGHGPGSPSSHKTTLPCPCCALQGALPAFHLPWDWAGWEAGERWKMRVSGECPLECPECGGERGRQAHQPGATQSVIPDYPNLKNKKRDEKERKAVFAIPAAGFEIPFSFPLSDRGDPCRVLQEEGPPRSPAASLTCSDVCLLQNPFAL